MLFLQFIMLLWVLLIRGPRLFGRHLKPVKGRPGYLVRKLYIYMFMDNEIRTLYAMHIGVEVKGGMIPFVVRREGWYHRYLKSLGLAHEIAIPDKEFDRKYYVTTDFPNHLEVLMADGPLLTELKNLMAEKVKSIHVGLNRAWCVLDSKYFEKDQAVYEPFYEALQRISRAVLTDTHRPKKHRQLFTVSAFLALHLALFVCGATGLISLLSNSDVIDDGYLLGYGLLASLAAIVVWQMAIVMIFKRTSWLGWVLADFWIWGFAGMLMMGTEMMNEVNMNLSQRPPVVKEQTVLRKECTLKCARSCGRRCTQTRSYNYVGDLACTPATRSKITEFHKKDNEICQAKSYFIYEVTAQGWRKHQDRFGYGLNVNESVFDGVKQGGKIHIPVYTGVLGLEWVDPAQARP